MKLLLASLAGLALLLLPAANAHGDGDYSTAFFSGAAQHIEVEVGPDFVDITVTDITIQGEMAHEARFTLDNSPIADDGAPDGRVSDVEVKRAEQFLLGAANAYLKHDPLEFLTIDGMPATETKITKLDIQGAAGSADSEEPITSDLTIRLKFAGVDTSLDRHTLRLEQLYGDFTGAEAGMAPPVRVTVQAKSPWSLDAASIEPEAFADNVEDGDLVLTNEDVREFDEMGEYLQFDITGDPDAEFGGDNNPLPGFEVLGALAALGAAVFVARRK